MKSIVLAAAFSVLANASASAADITLNITNIEKPEGRVMWSVYDSQEAYDSDSAPLIAARHRATGDSLSITLNNLPAGRYAVKLFHDANDNGSLDTNALGIPKEGYGFSNNGGRFGTPSFEDAAVTVDADVSIKVKLR